MDATYSFAEVQIPCRDPRRTTLTSSTHLRPLSDRDRHRMKDGHDQRLATRSGLEEDDDREQTGLLIDGHAAADQPTAFTVDTPSGQTG
jgi:hypothetical protein